MFFIPCIKWNKHYYVRTSCCNTLYELDPEMGKAIARGEQVLIRPEHLQRISKVTYGYNYKHCNYCGYETAENFEYCPKLKARGDVNLSRFQKGVLLTRTIVFPGTFPFWFFCGTFW